MKIIRDDKGRIVQVSKEESDGDINVVDVFKAEIEADTNKAIAIEKEITARHKEKCDFWGSIIINTVPPAIDSINIGLSKRDVENMSLELKDLS